jgi:hypothetical protein
MPKNDIVRSHGDLAEAGADWSMGATAKPEADEHHGRQHSKTEQSQMEGPAAYALHDEGEEKKGQGIVRDERGQEQPADNKRAQQSTGTPQVSQNGQNSGYSSGEKK